MISLGFALESRIRTLVVGYRREYVVGPHRMWKGSGGGWERVSLVGGGLCLIQMLTIRRFHPAIRVSISSIPQFRSDSRSSFEVSMELRGDLILPRKKIENWRKISLMHILVEKKAAS